MALQNILLLCPNLPPYAVQATEEVATQIAGHFLNIPDPPRKNYNVLKGNALSGWVDGNLLIDWEQDFLGLFIYEATEQPPPE